MKTVGHSPSAAWLAAVAAVFLAPAVALAQRVSKVEGAMVTLDVGSTAGVKERMTGRLFRKEVAGGKSVDAFQAAFKVVKVYPTSAVAVVTKGDPSGLSTEFRARFDEKLVPPAQVRPVAPPAPGPLAAPSLPTPTPSIEAAAPGPAPAVGPAAGSPANERSQSADEAGPFWIQVLVTKSAEKADGLAKKLRADGFKPDIALVPGKEGLWRVRVGPYPDRPRAEAAARMAERLEKLDATIVPAER